MCVCSSILLLLDVVELAFFMISDVCPVVVASSLGILLMPLAVSPGHVLKYPLLTALAHVSCTGINAAACWFFMVFYLPLTLCMLLIGCLSLSRLWRGNLHKLVISSLFPFNTNCSYFVTVMV